ncbi:hypothetical protein AaE_012745, partial [Aphanomyces astaci]
VGCHEPNHAAHVVQSAAGGHSTGSSHGVVVYGRPASPSKPSGRPHCRERASCDACMDADDPSLLKQTSQADVRSRSDHSVHTHHPRSYAGCECARRVLQERVWSSCHGPTPRRCRHRRQLPRPSACECFHKAWVLLSSPESAGRV